MRKYVTSFYNLYENIFHVWFYEPGDKIYSLQNSEVSEENITAFLVMILKLHEPLPLVNPCPQFFILRSEEI